jgi:DNA-binding winged helix-turn-helix (wHTH) protein
MSTIPTNLRVQMTALRRWLSDDSNRLRITNAPGRGYALTVVPGELESSDRPANPLEGQRRTYALPTRLTSLVGREDSVASIVKRLMEEAVHEPSAASDP